VCFAVSTVSTLKNVCSSMPFCSRMGVAIAETLSMVKARPIGEQKCSSDFSRNPRWRSSASDAPKKRLLTCVKF